MNKIPSFTIDHEKLLRGIYVSRKDTVGNDTVTTFDVRMKEPNREPVVHIGALHTLEHLAATLEPEDIVDLMRRTFRFVAGFEGEIPGAAPRDCGNYLLHDLPMARWEARKFLDEVLENIHPENLHYPIR